MVQYEEPQVTRMVRRIAAPETTGEQVVQALHGALSDAADERLEPEQLQVVMRAGGARLDERQRGVVESLARAKLRGEDADMAVDALRGDGGPWPRAE
jgi:hypothetical protein